VKIFLTLDYEMFFGSNTGTQERCILYPTELLIKILDTHNIKATFFIDSGYLIQMDKYRKEFPQIEADYQAVIAQIVKLDKNGHDIQLHIHPHWEDTIYDGKRWILDTSRYKLDDFSVSEVEDIVFRYKKVLTDIVGEKIFVFRAGGWCIQPFGKIKKALKKENIWLDSTLFKNGINKSKTHFFDFRGMPEDDEWNFEHDPMVINPNGYFKEVPISSYRVSPLFFLKLILLKKFGGIKHQSLGDGTAAGGSKWDKLRMLIKSTYSVVSMDGVKIDFLDKAYADYKRNHKENFVVIGHPKAFSPYSLDKLDSFLKKHQYEKFTTYQKEYSI